MRWRRIGVVPRGDQVRRTGGISEMPDSSKKTIQADSACAPFDPRPLVLDPVLDRLLVTFFGLPLGPLDGPAQPPRSSRHTDGFDRPTPVSPWMRTAIRSRVHTSVANPWASAPSSSACWIASSWSSGILGDGRSARGSGVPWSLRPASRHASDWHSGRRRPARGQPRPGSDPGRTAQRHVPGGPGGPLAPSRPAVVLAACGGWSTWPGMLAHQPPTVTSR